MAEGFKIADGYVSVTVRPDRGQLHRAAQEATDDFEAGLGGRFKDVGEHAGDDFTTGVRTTFHRKLEKALSEELKKAVDAGVTDFGRGDNSAFVRLTDRVESEFRKAGSKGGLGLWQELSKALGPEGMDSGLGRVVTQSFGQFGRKGGIQAGDAFEGGFMSVLGDMAGATWPALVPVGVGIASELLAAVGGVVSGGAGIASIFAGGLIQARSNPQVKAAAVGFGSWVAGEFKDASASFAAPLEDAFNILKADSAGPMSDLKRDWAIVAPYARDFAMYLGAAEEKIMPGVNRLLQNSGPLIKELGKDVVYVADGFSTLFDQISRGGKGEAEALDVLGRAIGDLLAGIGYTIHGASEIFDAFVQAEDAVTGFFEKVYHYAAYVAPPLELVSKAFGLVHDRADGVSRAFDDGGSSVSGFGRHLDMLTADIDRQKKEVDDLTTSWDKWLKGVLNVDEANISAHRSMSALSDSIKQNGRVWDLNTKAGQDNYETLVRGIRAQQDLRDANIASGMSTAQANAIFRQNTDAMLGAAHQAGFAGSQYAYLKSQVDGLSSALNSLDGKLVDTARLAKLSGSWGVKQGLSHGGAVFPGGFVRAAMGMLPPSSPGTLVLAGEPETGGEVMIPQKGISRDRAAVLGDMALAPYGLGVSDQHDRAAALAPVVAAWGGPAVRPMAPAQAAMPAAAASTTPATFGPYVIQVDGRVLASFMIDTVTGNPVAVSKAATEGDRLRRLQNSGRVSG